MKKSLITLMALAGISMGAVEGTWEAAFTTKDQSVDQTFDDYSAQFTSGAPITLSFTGLTITSGTTNGEYTTASPGSLNTSAIRPNANVCAETSSPYTLNFTITNVSEELLDIRAITFNAFLYNKSGSSHGTTLGTATSASFTLMSGETSLGTVNAGFPASSSRPANDFSMNADISLGDNYITLTAGASRDLALVVSKVSGKGSFVGLTGASFAVIPEPATATLSLLALCGLAARRRRK